MADLHWYYTGAAVESKQSFVRVVFDNQLFYQDQVYRTTYLMDIFKPKALILKEKRLLIYEQPPVDNGILAIRAPKGSTIEPLFKLLAVLNNRKTA
jgi:hypothetical protein